jgi:hypothetical protein
MTGGSIWDWDGLLQSVPLSGPLEQKLPRKKIRVKPVAVWRQLLQKADLQKLKKGDTGKEGSACLPPEKIETITLEIYHHSS